MASGRRCTNGCTRHGQPQTVPTAIICCRDRHCGIEVIHMESPTPLNPLGVKGRPPKAAPIGAPAAIVSAVEMRCGVSRAIRDLPLTPERLLTLIARRARLQRQASERGRTRASHGQQHRGTAVLRADGPHRAR